jgi:hypothetical protein
MCRCLQRRSFCRSSLHELGQAPQDLPSGKRRQVDSESPGVSGTNVPSHRRLALLASGIRTQATQALVAIRPAWLSSVQTLAYSNSDLGRAFRNELEKRTGCQRTRSAGVRAANGTASVTEALAPASPAASNASGVRRAGPLPSGANFKCKRAPTSRQVASPAWRAGPGPQPAPGTAQGGRGCRWQAPPGQA